MMITALRTTCLLATAGLATAGFCEDYTASACTDAFTGCAAAYNEMPAGDADASNDATERGTKACVAKHLSLVVDAATATTHCAHARGEGPCEPQHCADYTASACTDGFTGCAAAVNAMASGDTDATNDATEGGTQACVAKHLALVVDAATATTHCGHARGEGPCAATGTNGFCAAYAASDCTDAFTGCASAYGNMQAGDADASNDATERGTKACVAKHLSLVVDAATATTHCAHARGEGPCEPQHCADYTASACTDGFTGCAAAVNAMASGDTDATNDATEGGTQACVAKHLTLVDGATSAHCAHARGEGACAAPVSTTDKASGAGTTLGSAALAMAMALVATA